MASCLPRQLLDFFDIITLQAKYFSSKIWKEKKMETQNFTPPHLNFRTTIFSKTMCLPMRNQVFRCWVSNEFHALRRTLLLRLRPCKEYHATFFTCYGPLIPARIALHPASSICLQWFASKHIFIIVFIYPAVYIGFIGQSGTVNGLGFCGGSAGCNSVNAGGTCSSGSCVCNAGFSGLHCETGVPMRANQTVTLHPKKSAKKPQWFVISQLINLPQCCRSSFEANTSRLLCIAGSLTRIFNRRRNNCFHWRSLFVKETSQSANIFFELQLFSRFSSSSTIAITKLLWHSSIFATAWLFLHHSNMLHPPLHLDNDDPFYCLFSPLVASCGSISGSFRNLLVAWHFSPLFFAAGAFCEPVHRCHRERRNREWIGVLRYCFKRRLQLCQRRGIVRQLPLRLQRWFQRLSMRNQYVVFLCQLKFENEAAESVPGGVMESRRLTGRQADWGTSKPLHEIECETRVRQ